MVEKNGDLKDGLQSCLRVFEKGVAGGGRPAVVLAWVSFTKHFIEKDNQWAGFS